MTQRHNKSSAPPKMQRKILLYMIIFSAIMLSVIWLLQTVFLDDIYKSIKVNGIKSDTAYAAELAGSDRIEEGIYELAQNKNTCITVYTVHGKEATSTISAHIQPHCLIHSTFNDGMIRDMYEGAGSGKIYTKYIEAPNENFSNTILCSTSCSGSSRAETLKNANGKILFSQLGKLCRVRLSCLLFPDDGSK